MGFILSWFGTKIGKYVALLGAALGFVLLVFQAGKRDQRKAQEVKDLKEYKETRDEIDSVDVNTERDASIKRLRDNGRLR